MKKCTTCGKEKPLEEFHKTKNHKDGRHQKCKACAKIYTAFRYKEKREEILAKNLIWKNNNRERHRWLNKNNKYQKRYGITIDQKVELIKAQNNKCMICLQDMGLFSKAFVDHDHKTRKVRGILCDSCNRGIANFKVNTDLLQSAIRYLQHFNSLLDISIQFRYLRSMAANLWIT